LNTKNTDDPFAIKLAELWVYYNVSCK
jgi:hypothetical protein